MIRLSLAAAASSGPGTESRPKVVADSSGEVGGEALMSSFAIKYPFFIIVLCFMVAIVGTVTLGPHARGFVSPDQYSGGRCGRRFIPACRPQQIETDITDPFERFFTLGSGIDHIESRSLPGVSLIKIYFQPGTDPEC